jgi:pyruvate/2-oxoacid:ferredoxin oxidoreductase alpha subunit
VTALEENGVKVGAMIPQLLHPFPIDAFNKFLAGKKKLIIAELSYRGQFLQFIRSRCDIKAEVIHYARAGGKPFSVREIHQVVMEAL